MGKKKHPLTRSEVERDVDTEIEFHFERSINELIADGMSAADARRTAEERFGNVGRYSQKLKQTADVGRKQRAALVILESVFTDARQALRGLAREKLTAVTIIVTLALGIGANTTMFGIVDRLLLRPPPGITEPGAVKRLYVQRAFLDRTITSASVTYPDLLDFKAAGNFRDVAGYWNSSLPYRSDAAPRSIDVVAVTSRFFAVMGARPFIGRLFSTEADTDETVAVLDHGFWEREFGGDERVLGRSIHLGQKSYTIVGVASPGFRGVELRRTDVWLPALPAGDDIMNTPVWRTSRGFYWLRMVARLSPGVGSDVAAAEATTLHRLGRAEDTRYDPEATILVEHMLAARGPNGSAVARVSQWVLGVSIAVLLVACANVANLLLARMIRRRRELAVRLALGVSRSRLISFLTMESMALAATGGLVGLGFAFLFSERIAQVVLPSLVGTTIDQRAIWFAITVSLFAGIFAGLVPTIQGSNPNLMASVKSGTGDAATGDSRIRSALGVVQVCLSVLLLFGAGLFLKSLNQVNSIELGIDSENIMVASYDRSGFDFEDSQWDQFNNRAIETVAALPSVTSAVGVLGYPFGPSYGKGIEIPGLDSIPRGQDGGPYVSWVGPHYFKTVGTEIILGRDFDETDTAGQPLVVVVGEHMAQMLWPNESALGKCIGFSDEDGACMQVVGIARDTKRQNLTQANPSLLYYVPASQHDDPPHTVMARFAGDPTAATVAIRRAMSEVGPNQAAVNVRYMKDIISPQAQSWTLGATMLTAYGILALIVAAIGLYSLIAYSVDQRRKELGIRTALGATTPKLVWLVLRESLKIVLTGTVVGGGIAMLASPAMRDLLYQVSPRDPMVLATVAGILLSISFGAAVLPARKAAGVDPNEALRLEQ